MTRKMILVNNQLVQMPVEMKEEIELRKSGLKKVKPVTDPERIKEVEQVIEDMGPEQVVAVEGGIPELIEDNIYPSVPYEEWLKTQLLSYCDYIGLQVATAKNKTYIIEKIRAYENKTAL